MKNFASLLFRGLTLGSKFALIIFLARYLTVDELGVYGLFSVTINYALYFLGLDYYTYSTREMLSCPKSEWPRILRDQAAFTGLVYLIILPLCLLIFYCGFLDAKWLLWFFGILIIEHLNQESSRILVALQRPLWANSILFIRSGAWAYLVLGLMFVYSSTRNLEVVWFGWLLGGITSLILTAIALRDLEWSTIRGTEINWASIHKGVKVAIPYFVSTLALRGIFTFDRHVLKHCAGDAEVGVYTFFMGIANSLQSFVDAGVIVHYYPTMVKSYREGDVAEYRRQKRKLFIGITVTVVAMIVVITVTIGPVLTYIGKSAYQMKLQVLWLLLAAISMFCLSMVPHFGLYAQGKDRSLLVVTLICFIFCFVLYLLLIPKLAAVGAAVAVLSAATMMYILKAFIENKYFGK